MDMKQRIAKLDTSVTKPLLLNPYQAHFFLLVLTISLQLPFIFLFLLLVQVTTKHKRINWYHAQDDPLIYPKQKRHTTWTLNIILIVQFYNLDH